MIGSGITLIKPYVEAETADPALTERIETFKYLSGRIQHDSLDRSQKESMIVRWAGDSVSAVQWKSRADSVQRLLAHHPIRESVDSLLTRFGDTPVKPVNINEANIGKLSALPGIGPKLAERIVDYRDKNGPFNSIEDIQKVKGIGKKMFAKIKPFIDIR